jgi:hypothetical protein
MQPLLPALLGCFAVDLVEQVLRLIDQVVRIVDVQLLAGER